MADQSTELRTVVVEREISFPPEKIWRALTQPHLIEEWLKMKPDFSAQVGQTYKLTADWGAIEGRVLKSEPHTSLSYTWSAFGLESVVTYTLTPTPKGTLLRVEQSGFPTSMEFAYQGAQQAWPEYLAAIEELLAKGE
ncbi:MAG: SRPBCC domain-containing protein [Devosia sp.]